MIARVLWPISWPVWALGLLAWVAVTTLAYWWAWVPRQVFETHLEPPQVVNPATGYERTRWQRGDTFGVRYHTRIEQSCPVTYERWLTRADGLAYGPAHLGPPHTGHYRRDEDPAGKIFTAQVTLPLDIQPGQYAYTVRATSHCSPILPRVETSPPALVEVR